MTTEGVVEAFCGSEEAGSDDDESSSAATFREPRGVSVDGACNVLVADSKNHKVGLGFRVEAFIIEEPQGAGTISSRLAASNPQTLNSQPSSTRCVRCFRLVASPQQQEAGKGDSSMVSRTMRNSMDQGRQNLPNPTKVDAIFPFIHP